MTVLYSMFEKIHPLPIEFWDDLKSGVTEKHLPRKTLLLQHGSISKEIHFIDKGLARGFYFKNDTDVTSRFIRENELIFSVNSFFRQKPSFENIQLLEDSVLTSLSYDALAGLHDKYPQFNHVTRFLTEHYYILNEALVYSMRMKSARERYESLLASDPQIFQRVALKHIASYLGMKAETLSRLRARLR
ncbi:MAG TPA: Crp/Fnr family transcriptional regulator [Cyclobacteriaceae bacterium]|nr:Crp/Fnr family transcriptional regulator [Cyclobacteriaceae bacterium]